MSNAQLRTVYVENFPLTTPVSLVQKLFGNFGHVKGVDMPTFDQTHPICRGLPKPKSKGYAFIEFSHENEAQRACQFFNDLTYILSASVRLDHQDSQSFVSQSLSIEEIKEALSRRRQVDDKIGESEDLREKVLSNLEFKKLLLVRVMMKKEFQKLSEHYNQMRFQSLVRAAKMLLVA